MVVICGRNSDEMFYLTRDGDIEITCVGHSPYKAGGLYHYARQGILADSTEELDAFGRNRTDRLFIQVCEAVFNFVSWKEGEQFKSLSTRKDGALYLVRVQYDDVDLEMEVEEMYHYFADLSKKARENESK